MTKKLVLDETIFDIFPETQVYYFTIKNMDNHLTEENRLASKKMLEEAKEKAKIYIRDENFSSNEIIANWRNIYSKFKKKKGARSSIEAMLKRVKQEREFTPINPLVDIYNSVSLSYGVPCGSEDLDKIDGDMYLGVTKGNDEFYPLGSDKNEPTLDGEVCYYDNIGAICRCWNWRESQRTMLTEDTKNAVVVIESALDSQKNDSEQAINTLHNLVQQNLNGEVSDIVILNQNHSVGKL